MRNWRVLTDVDFEEVVLDLLTAKHGYSIERFAPGRDGGVDLRWVDDAGKVTIAQCKHYARSSFSQLYTSAKKEVGKVKHKAPSRYMFITSQELTPDNKEKLYQLFKQWMSGPQDVYSVYDLESLLDSHVSVERKHTKFWLATGSHLFWATNNDLMNRASSLHARIGKSLITYAGSGTYATARQILDEHRVCLIAGEPGIGKTVLAHMLIADAIRQGFEIYDVSEDINEALKVYAPEKSQIFLYDDFLGEFSFSERMGKNEDKRLVDFIDTVSETQSKRLILTTREYILRDAYGAYTELARINSRLRYIIEMKDYSRAEKGTILYNHLWQSDPPKEALREIADGGWKQVIDHPNYNPRLVEHCTKNAFTRAGAGYVSRFVEVLNNPTVLWSTPYERHIEEFDRTLLLMLSTFPHSAEMEQLAEAHQLLCRRLQLPWTRTMYRRCLDMLEGTFLEIDRSAGVLDRRHVRLSSPSVTEFVLNQLVDDISMQRDMLATIPFFEQLDRLRTVSTSNYVVGRRASRTPRRTVLSDTLRNEYAAAIQRTFDSSFLKVSYGTLRSRESRFELVSGLRFNWPIDKNWMRCQAQSLVKNWESHDGDKEIATSLVNPAPDNAAGEFFDNDAIDIVESWLWETRKDPEGYYQLVEFLDAHRDSNYDDKFVDELGEHISDQLSSWDPSPPDLDSLRELASRFLMGHFDDEFAEVDAAVDAADHKASSGDSSGNLSVEPSTADDDDTIGALFSRFRGD